MVRPPPSLDLSRDFGMRLSRCCAVLCALDRFLFHDAALGSTENLSLWIPSLVGYHACNSLLHSAVNKGRFRNQRACGFFFGNNTIIRRQDRFRIDNAITFKFNTLKLFWSWYNTYIFYISWKYMLNLYLWYFLFYYCFTDEIL